MGSSSTFHGLSGIKSRQPKSKVSARRRNDALVAKKTPLTEELRATLKKTPEIA